MVLVACREPRATRTVPSRVASSRAKAFRTAFPPLAWEDGCGRSASERHSGGGETRLWLAKPSLDQGIPDSASKRRRGAFAAGPEGRCSAVLSRSSPRRSRRKAGRTAHPGKVARGPVRSSALAWASPASGVSPSLGLGRSRTPPHGGAHRSHNRKSPWRRFASIKRASQAPSLVGREP